MTPKEYSSIAHTIPLLPGIYKYFDEEGNLLYVGKAKHLKKRVSSYFNKNIPSQKTVELVKKIHRIEFTIVDNEEDAFFLENTLIKEHQPVYNINLKDDKGYPYVVIKNERFPRVFFSRKKINDGSDYYGPYTSIQNAREIINFIKQYFPLRTCTLNLSEKNINRKNFKVCLEYHLGNCKGPCEEFQTADEYNSGIDQLKAMLKGNLSPIITHFKSLVSMHAEKLEFEKSAFFQAKIDSLLQYKKRSTVVDTRTGTVDVFSILEEGDIAFVNYLAVQQGTIKLTKTISLEKRLEETKEEVLCFAISRLRQVFNSDAAEIIIPFHIDFPSKNIFLTVPKAGDKKKLLDLSIKNVNHFKSELHARKLLKLEEKNNVEKMEVLQMLKSDLSLQELPLHIECFDNSNFQGTNSVAAMVCFKNGEPSKNDYRKFNIKTVEGINDFASMKEVVHRRYNRLQKSGESLPQLVIIDGGKGQLSAALESIQQLGLQGKMTLVGLAKNKEEIFFSKDSESLILPWNSESLKLIRRIRDEVHRFGITFHRDKRSKKAIENELEKIPGIGSATADLLLKKFKSVKKIKEQRLEDLEKVIGKSKALIVLQSL